MKTVVTHEELSREAVPDDAALCGEVLAPIPGERWECVAPAGHHPEVGHTAPDGTTW